MKRKSISWILNFVDNLSKKNDKIECLKQNDSNPIKTVLAFALNPEIEWLLPEGRPPFDTNKDSNTESMLYSEARKLYLFVKGGNDRLAPIRRERLFIDMLSILHPDDAELIIAIKDKQFPYKTITKELVEKAYPGIFNGQNS